MKRSFLPCLAAILCAAGSSSAQTTENPLLSPFRIPQPNQRGAVDTQRTRNSLFPAATPMPADNVMLPRAAASSSLPSASSGAMLRAADVVQVTVYLEPDLTTTARLGADGSITFPMLGQVSLSGLTGFQAQELIRKKLQADYLVDPQVSLAIVEHSKQYFTILGQIMRPGPYEIPLERSMGLLEAVGLAGGFTRTAKTSAVNVTRKEKTGDKKMRLDARKMARDGNSFGFVVQAGDTIIVDESFF